MLLKFLTPFNHDNLLHDCSAGMFVWADFSSLLPEDSWEGEEGFTAVCYEEGGFIMTPGQAQRASRPGWFRICFGWYSIEEEGQGAPLKRIFI